MATLIHEKSGVNTLNNMADFKQAYNITMAHEGGYANDKADTGGETWKGIARNKNPKWSGWTVVDEYRGKSGFPDNLNSAPGLQELVLLFYKKEFWDPLNLDSVNDQPIANEMFDTGVNMGQGIAATFLQRAINIANRAGKDYADIKVDGAIGGKTVEVLNASADQKLILKLLNILQGSRYISICENNPTQERFLRSWMSRVSAY